MGKISEFRWNERLSPKRDENWKTANESKESELIYHSKQKSVKNISFVFVVFSLLIDKF